MLMGEQEERRGAGGGGWGGTEGGRGAVHRPGTGLEAGGRAGRQGSPVRWTQRRATPVQTGLFNILAGSHTLPRPSQEGACLHG